MTRASLNPAQQAAVEHERGPALVIAGAGSGKTRVLTGRVEWLLEHGVRPEALLAFTFTNRAAREMRGRIEAAVGDAARRLWIGTFHATALRILRRETATLGLPPAFTIVDRDDQEALLRDLIRELGLPEAVYRTPVVLGRISDNKNGLVFPAAAETLARSEFDGQVAALYRRYDASLRRAGALDFDDLIAQAVRLWLDHPAAGERWSRRFQHVLVDEYQDTNHAQFRLVQSLASVHGNVFVVGDDDQSIYGWRGADLANVLEFERAFPGAVTLRLEQNYRSTRNILDAANAVIAHNHARKGKTLWSERGAGTRVAFALEPDEAFEARRVRHWLERQRARGRRLTDCGVLYRTNAQSRALETELRHAGLPYEIVGGVSFFQRREVKDVLAYLRLIVNPLDQISFFRVWNTPRRGLGPAVEAALRARLSAGAPDPVAALRSLADEGALRGPARAGAARFLSLVDELRAHVSEPLDRLFALLLERSGYLEELETSAEPDAGERRANVEELGVAASQFAAERAAAERAAADTAAVVADDAVAEPGGDLLAWLSECSLLTDADRAGGGDRVLLLTVHNAKGLEFDVVAVTGLEEGLLPHGSSMETTAELEEERRLFYVALTRARDEVLLTAAAYRRRFDGAWGAAVSRFVGEIPDELLEREDATVWTARGAHARRRPATAWRRAAGDAGEPGAGADAAEIPFVGSGRSASARRAVGRRVIHDSFGPGTVLEADGEGPEMKLTVRFTGAVKKVYARFVSGVDDGD